MALGWKLVRHTVELFCVQVHATEHRHRRLAVHHPSLRADAAARAALQVDARTQQRRPPPHPSATAVLADNALSQCWPCSTAACRHVVRSCNALSVASYSHVWRQAAYNPQGSSVQRRGDATFQLRLRFP
eukprot:TRINITY_DN20855_c0_g1_i1.p1 TRINITY_DN20855_c0_g1~~TRINITY_DN20855_c0_g1_i1.p1  ORF type:complete len:130 (+),score=10.99 TRINITY_DN20855_c0_g1_i1:83-472(+)